MRKISAKHLTEVIKREVIAANLQLGDDMIEALRRARNIEESEVGKEILDKLLENAELASANRIPICQDTGLVVIFAELGQEVCIVDGDFTEAIEEGVRVGYQEGYLRKSVCHPFTRENTGDNTPVIIHLDMVPGDRLRLWVVPKGGGSENMSALYMLPPSAGWNGVKEKVVETVVRAGPNPCPPTIVGVGIGGNFEKCAILAKKALLRPVSEPNPVAELQAMEVELLEEINKSGVGPEGLGGRVTSLAVHINMMPCHIASLPVAVNIQCHANRHREVLL
ncbi:MAG: fumarate hydratase [Deltaproteobacteria bacterium]|nr:fumarate hydratase [Deltaproteobacteria bacterium]MBW2082222.1 fumarate hydratase [Deltaproteobacteria bacterium]HDM10302.1 fumarate hydratase [Desulfobacteraceae bacterium]